MEQANAGIFQKFLNSEKAGGLILICCTVVAMTLANSSHGTGFIHFWHTSLPLHIGPINIPFSVEEWINEGLMVFFFLMVGLEIERELYIGELSSIKDAALPICAAIGGMVVPALIHFILNHGKPEQAGFGIPMATDIAFCLGVLALMGNRIPVSFKIFLVALAIIDDLGSVILIAVFYTPSFSFSFLLLALVLWSVLLLFNRLNIFALWVYLLPGLLLWYLIYKSGVHPTLAGILLAFALPFRKKTQKQPSYVLLHALHKPVNFLIIPLFALANTAIFLPGDWKTEIISSNSMGISLGLILGKPLGIAGFSALGIALGIAKLPEDMTVSNLIGLGFLGGIGFTMAIFISNLAFSGNDALISSSKVAVLFASLIAAVLGLIFLSRIQKRKWH